LTNDGVSPTHPQDDSIANSSRLLVDKGTQELLGSGAGKSAVDRPVISVITIVLNDLAGLSKTIQSVLSQTYGAVEHIVVDGDSQDGTTDVIRRFEGHLACWVSEPDRGISDAFNKGIELATGSWINFLNAGDIYEGTETLEKLAPYFSGQRIVTGFIRIGDVISPNRVLKNEDPLVRRARIAHQASFVHRRVFDQIGNFNLDFKLRMDYEFWLRALSEIEFLFVQRVISNLTPGGISSRYPDIDYEEEIRANRMHLTSPLTSNLIAFLRRRCPGTVPLFSYLRRHFPWLLVLWRD
jgi:glycosyltransferase involved in cell wall biosynthesis